MKDTKRTNQEIWDKAIADIGEGVKAIANSVDSTAEDFNGNDTDTAVLCMTAMDDVDSVLVAVGGGENALVKLIVGAMKRNESVRIGVLTAIVYEEIADADKVKAYHEKCTMVSMLKDTKLDR